MADLTWPHSCKKLRHLGNYSISMKFSQCKLSNRLAYFGDICILRHLCHFLHRSFPDSCCRCCDILFISQLVLACLTPVHNFLNWRAHLAEQTFRAILRRNNFREVGASVLGDWNSVAFYFLSESGSSWSSKYCEYSKNSTFSCLAISIGNHFLDRKTSVVNGDRSIYCSLQK